jgi:hypothetical protein
MKGRALILIFLFLILFFFVISTPVSAEIIEDSFYHSGGASEDYIAGFDSGGSLDFYVDRILINDAETLADIKFLQVEVDGSQFVQTKDSNYNGVTLSIGGTPVGSGVYGYTYNPTRTKAYIQLWVQEIDLSGYSGQQYLIMSGHQSLQTKLGSNLGRWSNPSSDSRYAYFSYSGFSAMTDTNDGEYSVQSSYIKEFNFNYSNDYGVNRFLMERDTNLQSKLNITIDGDLVKEESTMQTYDVDYVNSSFNTWTVRNEDVYGYAVTKTLEFGDLVGTINFNQTSYIDPENIEVEWNINGYNSNSFNYEIQVVTSISGDPSQDSWAADGNWNISPFISSASGAAVFDFYSDGYDLPIWIQAELWAQDKTTGTWTRLDSTPVERYHEAALDFGKISTDKASYNVSEIVTVTYTSYAGNIKIRAYQHGSITTYWYNDLSSGTDQTIKISFDEKDRGPWDLRLIENDVFTNYTSIEITSGDIPYVKWYRSVYDQGQIVPYRIGGSGGLMLYSTDVNATLSIFDAASTEIYNFSVGSGNNNMQINFAESAAPGMWTASLLNLGSRYNDTTMVTSTSSLISFNSSVYVTGDTIGINYFIPSSDYRIMLLDANFKEIIIFTTQNGVLSTGTYQTIPFSLVDNNEYGFNMIAAIDAGSYTTGYWEVWVVDQYGTFLDNGTVWDRAKVSKSSGDSADTSNEMISIFFSPEGAFLLFTVCLTMMGLVAAKHPAGGGAGAVVGVGFGVYFDVLPVWMLMLTVILLVVMAGVSIAVYYKGK